MVIKKIIKAAAKKGLKSKSKARKVRSPPKPKVKSKATIERDRNQKKFVAMHKKVQVKRKTKSVTIPRKRKYVAPPPRKDGLQDKERVKWDGVSPKWRAGYAEKGKRSVQRELWAKKRALAWKGRTDARSWGSFDKGIETKRSGGKYGAYVSKPPTGMAKRSIENKLHKWRQDKIIRDTEGAWRSGWNPNVGKKPVRKGPRTVGGLDRDDWFMVGLAASGPAIGAGYWENKEAINKLPGKAIDVIKNRRNALLRRLGLI